MTLVEFMPWLAGVGLAAFLVATAGTDGSSRPGSWMLPATLSVLFLAWSVAAILVEGPVGFWREHTRNLWGNQIWFDLLLAIGIGWFLIVPQTKALGMRIYPWLLLILCTGCIGFLAMVSRLMYLREQCRERGHK